jgi:sugar lactone lactonase YvrE
MFPVRRFALLAVVVSTLAALVAASLAGAGAEKKKPSPREKNSFPATIQLPVGFQPEGISIRGQAFYVGSIPTGVVRRGLLRTGQSSPLVPSASGHAAIGLQVDHRGRLFVSGGGTGRAFVYNARTGALLAEYQLASAPTFINDVVVTREAVWFTDSSKPILHKLPLGKHGQLPGPGGVQHVALSGDYKHAPGFNANGIDATPSGKTLVIVQSNEGKLFTVNPTNGQTHRIELGGDVIRVRNGDGILLDGKRLYVVQNQNNQIAVIRLDQNLGSGKILAFIKDARFNVPTTIDEFGPFLYAVNARFGVVSPTTATYSIVRVRKR